MQTSAGEVQSCFNVEFALNYWTYGVMFRVLTPTAVC